jgi:hypothetical protein
MTTPTWVIPGGANKLLYEVGGGIGDATIGAGLTLAGGVLETSIGSAMVFGVASDVQGAQITSNVTTVQTVGYGSTGDGGGGAYTRVASLPSLYGDPGVIPPGFTSGLPVLCFATTLANSSVPWVISQPILAGCLTVLVMFSLSGGAPTSFTDGVGNVYTRAVTATGGPFGYPIALYYCLNPVAAPVGTSFDSMRVSGSTNVLNVYCVYGFKGAVLDTTASQVYSSSAGGISLIMPGMAGVQELVFGAVDSGGQPQSTHQAALPYTTPAGWIDIAPPHSYRNPISVTTVSGVSSVTYGPGWTSSSPAAVAMMAAFKVYPASVINAGYWQLVPKWPMHASQYGILPGPVDNGPAFLNFGAWLASAAPASYSSVNGFGNPSVTFVVNSGTYTSSTGIITVVTAAAVYGFAVGDSVTLSGMAGSAPAPLNGNWAVTAVSGTNVTLQGPVGAAATTVTGGNLLPGGCSINIGMSQITLNSPRYSSATGALPFSPIRPHRIRQGQSISFSTTGALPTGIVANQRYFVQYGTVANPPTNTIQLSSTNFISDHRTIAKGPTISLGGSQSGVHTYTVYGESWVDIVLDPGLYYVGNNQFLTGYGLKKVRIYGYGARFQSNVYTVAGGYPYDLNAATGGSGFTFVTQFKTINFTVEGVEPYYVMLANPALASNFYPNSWVVLMSMEFQNSDTGNWNQNTFEFAQIMSVDTGTGKITFWDNLLNSYRSTLPTFEMTTSGYVTRTGPASIVQLGDSFDQQIEIHGVAFYAPVEENAGGVLSVKFIDCDFFGWAFHTGPFPSFMRRFITEKCRFYDCVVEIDKMIDYVEYTDCDFDQTSGLHTQSSTVNMFVLDNCRFASGIRGTPKNTIIRNCFVGGNLLVGCVFGVNERMLIEGSHIAYVACSRAENTNLAVYQSGFSFSNGTIKIAPGSNGWVAPGTGTYSANPLPYAAPGSKLTIVSSVANAGTPLGVSLFPDQFLGMMSVFTVLDVYVDGSNNYCLDTDLVAFPSSTFTATGNIASGSTTLNITAITPADASIMQHVGVTGPGLAAGTTVATNLGVPNATGGVGAYTLSAAATGAGSGTYTFDATNTMIYVAHPCPRLTVRNCTGGRFVADQVGAPSDIPIMSYFNRTYEGLAWSAYHSYGYVQLTGYLKSWTINVTQPYTGADATFTCTIYMFGWKSAGGGNMYPTFVQQTIDMKTAGLRTIGPTGTPTGLGADSLVSVPFWLVGGHTIGFTDSGSDTNLVNMPRMVMVAQSDQNIGSASLVVKTPHRASVDPSVMAGADELSDTSLGTGYIGG